MLAFQVNSPVLKLLRPDCFVENLTVCIGCIATIYLLCHADWWMGVVLINLLWQLVFSVNLPQSFIIISLQNEKPCLLFYFSAIFQLFNVFPILNITQHADAEDWLIFGHAINCIKIIVQRALNDYFYWNYIQNFWNKSSVQLSWSKKTL